VKDEPEIIVVNQDTFR